MQFGWRVELGKWSRNIFFRQTCPAWKIASDRIGELKQEVRRASILPPDLRPVVQGGIPDPGPNGPGDDYWPFATRSDNVPTVTMASLAGDITNPGTNVANYINGADWNGKNGNVTTVGSARRNSACYYGTFDQSGNVEECIESGISGNRAVFGGFSGDLAAQLRADSIFLPGSTGETDHSGFRVGANIVANLVEGDINADGIVNAADYTLWANNFGMSVSAPVATARSLAEPVPPTTVPEPSALALLVIGAFGAIALRPRGRPALLESSAI